LAQQPGSSSGEPPRGSPAPALIILAITVIVMIAGVLVVLYPDATGVPGLDITRATQTAVAASPTAGD
jgi:hypothetical protein